MSQSSTSKSSDPDNVIAQKFDDFCKRYEAIKKTNKYPEDCVKEWKEYEVKNSSLASKISEKYVEFKRIQVFIQKLSGGCFTLHAIPLDKVEIIFKESEKQVGIPADQLRFIYGGKGVYMESNKSAMSLMDYKVHDLSTIYMVLRLAGGMIKEQDKDKDEYECCIDLDIIKKKDVAISCPSSHVMCENAKNRFLQEVVLKSLEDTFPPRCPQCGQPYGLESIMDLIGKLPEKSRMEFMNKAIYYHSVFQIMEKDDRRVKCPNCDYFEIHTYTSGADFIKCKNDKCLTKTCIYCKKLASENHSKCETLGYVKLEMEEAIHNATYRRCPTCKAGGQKDAQCSHMTCLCCKTEYCYICLKTKTELGENFMKHFGDGKDLPKCPRWMNNVPGFGNGDEAVLKFHANLRLIYLKKVFDKYGIGKAKETEAFYEILKNNGYTIENVIAAPKSPFA